MTHPNDWPLKGKPTTNLGIQVALGIFTGGLFIVMPIPMLLAFATLIVFFGGRTIIREVRKEWWPTKPDWVVISDKGTQKLGETDEGKLFAIVGLKNKCPDCGGEGFFEGPSGGMSTNIICRRAHCRSKFNITSFGNNHGTCERIGRDPLTALDGYPPESFGKDLTPDQIAAAKAKIIADETPKPLAQDDCGTCHAPLDAKGQCPNN